MLIVTADGVLAGGGVLPPLLGLGAVVPPPQLQSPSATAAAAATPTTTWDRMGMSSKTEMVVVWRSNHGAVTGAFKSTV